MTKKVLRFTASWCQPCKTLANILDGIENKPDIDVVDIDENLDLAQQYKIRGVPTLVMLEDGVEVKRITGTQTAAQLQNWLG